MIERLDNFLNFGIDLINEMIDAVNANTERIEGLDDRDTQRGIDDVLFFKEYSKLKEKVESLEAGIALVGQPVIETSTATTAGVQPKGDV